MKKTVITSFKPPRVVQLALSLLGFRVICQATLDDDWSAFADVSMGIWAAAQREFRGAILALHDGEDCHALSAHRIAGIPEGTCRHALAQLLSVTTLYPYSFVRVAANAYPDGIVVVDFPPKFVHLLKAEGFTCNRRWSFAAWGLRSIVLRAKAVAAHFAHALLRVRDDLRPPVVNTSASSSLVLWSGAFPAEMEAPLYATNIGDFVLRAPGISGPGVRFVIECADPPRYNPSTVVVPSLLQARCQGRGSTGRVTRSLLEQTRLMSQMILGGWREALMATEIAKLPRGRVCLDALNPQCIALSIASVQYVPLWIRLGRCKGVPVSVFCNSTQVFPVKHQGEYEGVVVTDAYLLPGDDEYFVWDHEHKSDLEAAGVDPARLRVVGPVIFSSEPSPSDRAKTTDTKIRIDYFDQPPASRKKLIRMGRPQVFHSPDRAIDTLEAVLHIASIVFQDTDWVVRLKPKRSLTDQEDNLYASKIEKLAQTSRNFECVDPRTSPPFLHVDSNVTIGFPFVSPTISAATYGVPSCFFDVGGDVESASHLKHGLPVLRGHAALLAWLETIRDSAISSRPPAVDASRPTR